MTQSREELRRLFEEVGWDDDFPSPLSDFNIGDVITLMKEPPHDKKLKKDGKTITWRAVKLKDGRALNVKFFTRLDNGIITKSNIPEARLMEIIERGDSYKITDVKRVWRTSYSGDKYLDYEFTFKEV